MLKQRSSNNPSSPASARDYSASNLLAKHHSLPPARVAPFSPSKSSHYKKEPCLWRSLSCFIFDVPNSLNNTTFIEYASSVFLDLRQLAPASRRANQRVSPGPKIRSRRRSYARSYTRFSCLWHLPRSGPFCRIYFFCSLHNYTKNSV